MTRIVHTADWHLGARLIDCDRHAEHEAFLRWVLPRLVELQPDLLIVAGDIFDSTTPSQDSLRLYYTFLAELAATVRCQVLILGGNHDSPGTLQAPRDILSALKIRVIAIPPEEAADALIELPDAVVCAVPFLRERDIRTSLPGQSPTEVAAAIRQGITAHYREIYAAAQAIAGGRPLIATGHLTAVDSKTGGSERSIHVGNLGAVAASCFEGFAYTALGHIHRAQCVGGNETIRYSGSPLPLSFAEVDLAKELRVLEIENSQVTQRALPIPTFRSLLRLTTETASMRTLLQQHPAEMGSPFEPWIELTVTDGFKHPDVERQMRQAAAELNLRVLKLQTPLPEAQASAQVGTRPQSLTELTPQEVFVERLKRGSIDPESEEGQALLATFELLLHGMKEQVA